MTFSQLGVRGINNNNSSCSNSSKNSNTRKLNAFLFIDFCLHKIESIVVVNVDNGTVIIHQLETSTFLLSQKTQNLSSEWILCNQINLCHDITFQANKNIKWLPSTNFTLPSLKTSLRVSKDVKAITISNYGLVKFEDLLLLFNTLALFITYLKYIQFRYWL